MKKFPKLLLTSALSVILIFSSLYGCTPSEGTPKDSSTPAESPIETPADTPAETPAETPVETPESSTPEQTEPTDPPAEDYAWLVGFGAREIDVPINPKTPLYIAGYNQGVKISSIRDLQRANAIWLDGANDGVGGIMVISIDCVGLASKYVKEIRTRLADFTAESGCEAINVISTHTHAGLDTFGLWGPKGVDGKNAEFMENLVNAAVEAAKAAYADRSEGTLHYSFVKTDTAFLRDSRVPIVLDPNLYQIRFEPRDASQNGIRIVSYGAHAESLRGANTILSRDYPGEVSDILMEKTGDDMLYLPGPIGGLVMTQEIVSPFNAVKNLEATGKKLADYLLSIRKSSEVEIAPTLSFVRESLEVPVENGVFKLYKELGILENEIYTDDSGNVIVKSEINLISIGGKEGVLFGLIPGEIFPELVSGKALKAGDPTALSKLVSDAGISRFVVVNLANDELGYIVPPSDFIVHPTNPYFQRYEVNGEDHYEETNSVGKQCAARIAAAFEAALKKLG